MKIRSKIKNTMLAGLAGLSLTACGGGGGGPGAIIDNTRTAISSLNTALYGHHGASGTVGSSTISSSIENLMSISSNYSPQNSDREDAKLVVEFFNEWETFNASLEKMKNSTTGRKDFDAYMNSTFGDTAELRAAGLANKTWRDAHKEIHGAYLLLVKHKTLITRYANGDKIYTDETAYKNFINDAELNVYENLSDQEIDIRLRTKAETDTNLVKYNDIAIAEKNITELDTIHTIVNSAVNNINSLESSISSSISANLASVSGIVNYHDVEKSKNIITSVESGITAFERILSDLDSNSGLTIKQKLDYYKGEDFKSAYKSYLYLKNDVKPILEKIKNANTDQVKLDSTEVNILATDGKDNYSTDLTNFVNPKIATLEQEYSDLNTTVVDKERLWDEDPVASTGTPVITYSDWVTIYQGGGNEQRTKTTTTPNYTTVVSKKCTWKEYTLDGATTKGAETCVTTNTATNTLDPTVTIETETREGDNPVVGNPVSLDPVVTTTTEESAQYTDTTYQDASDTTTEITEGSATTNTANRDVTVTTNHGNNTSTTVVTRYVDTTVTIHYDQSI